MGENLLEEWHNSRVLKNQLVFSQEEKGKLEFQAKGTACTKEQGHDRIWCLQETESSLQWLGQRSIQGPYMLVVVLPALSKTSGFPFMLGPCYSEGREGGGVLHGST